MGVSLTDPSHRHSGEPKFSSSDRASEDSEVALKDILLHFTPTT